MNRRQPKLPISRLALAFTLVVLLLAGCAGTGKFCTSDQSCVSDNLACRTGHALGPCECPRETVYPNGIRLTDELTEEEAVVLALWNNALFLETLTDLGIAHGDLVQAGLLPNPEFVYFWPASDKPFKYAFDFPLEALWLRPIRIRAAESEYQRVCQRLTQTGLDLMRDTRQAYADLVLAHARRQVAADAVAIRGRIAQLAKSRLDAGDISPQEYSTAVIDAARAQQDVVRTAYEIQLAEQRLRNWMGLPEDRTSYRVWNHAPALPAPPDMYALEAEATNNRPDALAAAQAADAAAERVRLTKLVWFRCLGILDATSGRASGHEFSPAVRATIPIFHWNQGAIARADAEWEKAERQRETIHNQIVLDVRQAHLRWSQSQAELDILREQVQPEVEIAIRRTEKAYQEGETPYVVVLQTTQQLIDSRLREVQLQADLRRSWADLERSVGRHLEDVAPPPREVIPIPSPQPPVPQDAPTGPEPPRP